MRYRTPSDATGLLARDSLFNLVTQISRIAISSGGFPLFVKGTSKGGRCLSPVGVFADATQSRVRVPYKSQEP
jgi:hypothetical protein